MKDPRTKKPKSRFQEPKVLALQQNAEIPEKAQKEKKKNNC